jgi:RNA polymerase sigma-54 factor
MKPSLQFRLSQHLTLTPQLQQSIRLLQLSTIELNQEIDRILMENPALEREDADDGEAPAAPAAGSSTTSVATESAAPEADWSPETAASWRGSEDDEGEKSFTPPDTPTLRDHLHAQLSLTKLGPRDRGFVALLIDALDDDGYLTQSLEEIAALLPPEAEAAPEELSIALRHLQHFEPAGVGARSPGE